MWIIIWNVRWFGRNEKRAVIRKFVRKSGGTSALSGSLQMDSINPIGDWSIFRTRIWGCANNWWTAAYGQVSLNGMILPAALYFWQIPHFMALAYLCRNDYAAGGFKMFSLADASGQRTALVALRNCLYLLPLGFLASNWGITSEWFCIESSLFTLFMSAGALSFYRNRTTRNARRMFHASLLYLPVFMSGLLLHRLPNSEHEFTVTDSDTRVPLSFSKSSLEVENTDHQIKPRCNPVGSQARPPVAYASVAPFPFLPAPLYVAPDP